MKQQQENPYDALEKIFHEPNRLAIVSALCAADGGLSFTELKDECGLTDGNLNRHLKVLQDSGVVRIRKSFVDAKPRTTVQLSDKGIQRFNLYLEALSDVLNKAEAAIAAVGTDKAKTAGAPAGKTVRA
ncbi:MAG: transcriptional regulator [Kiritimatiellae bacterium]|nr:transcriptional regulator [Kiritimatiellia bacterium]